MPIKIKTMYGLAPIPFVLPGIQIGNHLQRHQTGSIITKRHPPYSVVVGNPARIVKIRYGFEKNG